MSIRPSATPFREGGGPVLCPHVCGEDSGCVAKELSCAHEHDAACGYAPETPGALCLFVCRVCPIEKLISELPQSVSVHNSEQVREQINEIYDLYDGLTADEQEQVDLSPCISLLDQIDGEADLLWSGKWNLTNNQTFTEPHEVTGPGVIETNEFTLYGTGASVIRVAEKGDLELRGNVSSSKAVGVVVLSGGSLRVMGPNTGIRGESYALDVASGAKVQLFTGRYFGKKAAIRTADGDFAALLAPGCAYFDESGNPLLPAGIAEATTVIVGQCDGHGDKVYERNAGTTEHTWTCPLCGTEESEPCTFTFAQDGTGICGFCRNEATIAVDRDSLKVLAYDETVQPENGTVTVTAKDAAKPLALDTDYTVEYKTQAAVGDIGFTVTVTVTGKAYNGTFTKDYEFTKDELERPVLEWNTTSKPVPVELDYDGSPVEKDDLPPVNINIQTSAGVDLHGQLSYSHRAQGSGGAYTNGLPTNAGTYDVVVTLPEGPDYQAASSEPITLTVRKISPIATPPAAAKPTYNGTKQELVTPGALKPVAVDDGLEIKFATNENGPYSTTIPTGTDAGNYQVWYTVEVTDNYLAIDPDPSEAAGVEIQRKPITPVVELSQTKYQYDGDWKEPAVTVKDGDTVLPTSEYSVTYENNQNVSTPDKPAKVIVTDKAGGNYDITEVTVTFQITLQEQATLSITQRPDTFIYGDKFTLGTLGGSGNGLVTWEITDGNAVAEVDSKSGQVKIIGHGEATVKAAKSGTDPVTGLTNYQDAVAFLTFTAEKKSVTATVTAEDKDYDGDNKATIHAVVEQGVLPGDVIKIEGLKGAFDDENAGVDKNVAVDITDATITGKNSEHYSVSYSSTTVKATIHKAVAKITAPPVAAAPTYNGNEQDLIATGAVVNTTGVVVEYALSQDGPYSTDFPKGANAGDYTVWYRIQETDNYTGEAPQSVAVTIAKKPVNPTIELSGDGLTVEPDGTYSYVYDGTAKEPVVTLKEADGTTVVPAGEYTVGYSGNINVGTATVAATAKPDGNYSFENAPVTETFVIQKEKAKVTTAPKKAGDPLIFNTRNQNLVVPGAGSGGTMVYSVDNANGTYSPDLPTGLNAKDYTVYYKIEGDDNHSDSDVGSVVVTIAPKTVKDPTITLFDENGDPLVSYTYDGSAKEPQVTVIDGDKLIAAGEYEVRYANNIDAGNTATVNIIDKPGGNYIVTGSATFVIEKADIVFAPAPTAANITYDGKPHELLRPGTASGGEVLYALNSATSTYTAAIPQATLAGDYTVYYKVVGDKNHNDLAVQSVPVAIQRKPLADITIELTPDSFEYDGSVKMPTVAVKFTEGKIETVVPITEYDWTCDNTAPTDQGTYTITITDEAGGNYDLSGVTANTATFTIGKTAQAPLVIEGEPTSTVYGGTFTLAASGGSSSSAVVWSVAGPAIVDAATGDVEITGVGEVTITATNPGDQNYLPVSGHWTFTAAPKPVTASVVVGNRDYDGTTDATVGSASIATINGDTVDIDPASITAAFDTPGVGTGKTVTLDTSKVRVTGADAAKYAISYPDTVAADITQATTTVTTAPEKIDPLTYNGQPQALATAGTTNVGFLVYSLDGTNFSPDIPTGTDAGTYTVYYKVDGTADYTGVAVNTTPVSVIIAPKAITAKVEPPEFSFLYDGTTKVPEFTVLDGKTVIDPDQYTVTWKNVNPMVTDGLLTIAGSYSATIKNVPNGNYLFTATAKAEIVPAEQAAIEITGQPEHVYYGDRITTLKTSGGTGDGTVAWSVTAGGASAEIVSDTGVLTIKGTGSVTVKAERTVPNYGTVSNTWTFDVEPKPVLAEAAITAKVYDGTTAVADADIAVAVKSSDLVDSANDVITITAKGAYDNANVGTGKTVTLSDVAVAADADKYAVSYPATAQGDITPRGVTVTVTLSGNDLQTDDSVTPPAYSYNYDGTEKNPNVTVTADDDNAVLADSDYSVNITDNKNVGNATVTVTAKEGGNYTFTEAEVQFAIKESGAVLTKDPAAKDLTYTGQPQDLVDVGTATGGTVVYSDTDKDDPDSYSETIPQGTNAGTYTVYYMVKGDDNHADTAPGQVSVTIKPKEITPAITLNPVSFVYDGTAKTPAVTVKDGTDTIDGSEYSVSYRDNTNAGTATATVSNNNGGNYIVNGTATFEITKKAPTVTDPVGKTGLQYNGERQDLVQAGVTNDGTVVYSVNGGNYTPAVPSELAVGTYTIEWKVLGDNNHSDTAPATLTVSIGKNQVNTPGISLSSNEFKYTGSQQKPVITVYDDSGRLIPEQEYTVAITGTNGNVGMVDVDTYTVTITTPGISGDSNYDIVNNGTANVRTFKIVPADQESISITGTRDQVRYGDGIQLGVTGGTGAGTISWTVAAKDGSAIASTISPTGLLTVRDVGGPLVVTVARTRPNYGTVSAEWEFSAGKKPVTAVLTGVDRPYAAGVKTVTVTAAVPDSELVAGDSITIADLSGMFDTDSVGTGKKVAVDRSNPNISGNNSEKYAVAIPETATASILAGAATVDTDPEAAPNLTYDASKAQELVAAGTVTGGTMVYSLDGTNFTAAIPKAKNAGTYTVYFKAQGDINHTDSAVKSVQATIDKQTVASGDVQIELTPPSAQYDGSAKYPEVTVRDTDNNVIPESEYKATYVSDSGENWTNQGTYTVKVENITGGNYVVETATADFVISTSAQAPLEIVNKPGLVHYGDTFTLSAVGGSGDGKVTWSSAPAGIVEIDANGFVKVVGVGSATITATKPGGGNYDTMTADYPLNALQKPITAIATAKDRVYKAGDASAELIISWKPGDLVGSDTIDTSNITGQFKDDSAGTGKTVDITGAPVDDATSQKYAITIPPTTTASILKADTVAPPITANTLTYTGAAQALVTGGDANTLYSDTRDGVYSAAVPTGTDAKTYTVWYKQKGDDNHNDSQPQAIQAAISQKTLTADTANTTLFGSDLQTDAASRTYYYEYDGSDKTPSVIIKDGSAAIPASEYTVAYSNNKNVGEATVTITNSEGGNYVVNGSVMFEIRKGGAELTSSPQPVRGLTYTGQPQQLVTVGTATGGHIEYAVGDTVSDGDYSKNIPARTDAGSYVVHYKVVGDGNHAVDSAQAGSVTVAISPKEVISPTITVSGTYTYDGSAKEPGAANVKVEDGATLIPSGEYTLSYRDNVNAGTAAVIVTNANGGNYIVNGEAAFEIAKAAATVDAAPTGKTGLHYNGSAQELLATQGTATGGTMAYALSQTGEYSAAIPTGKAVGEYEIWYKVLGDANHSDSAAAALSPKVEIGKNTVSNPTIQITPPSATYNGKKQEPTVTVKDDDGLLIDGSEYTVDYLDENNNSDLTQVGTYTVTITEATGGNYTFSTTKTATFTITPADQTALAITGTRERVYYGDTIPLGTTGGNGTVTWTISDGSIASIDANGLLKITGVGSATVTATSKKTGYADQTATWNLYAEKKPVTALVTAASKAYDSNADAAVTATLQASDFVGTDSFTITLNGCTFEDPNAGTDKKVNVVSTNPSFTASAGGTDNHGNYAITYPATAAASIFKADIAAADVTAPALATGLEYTGLPQALIAAAGAATGGTLEYSVDGANYSTGFPTGTNAGDYEVWYRVKGDGNHNDVAGTKLSGKVNIARQTVSNPTIEFTPTGATYDGQEHKPTVKVMDDAHGRVIPDSEYTIDYGSTNWKDVGDHTITITGKTDGNYTITGTPSKIFTILPAGQSPLSIVGQPGEVRYGTVFTLTATGGSGTGAVTWETSDSTVASINSQTGRVEILKAGGPVTITARKAAGGGYGEMTATYTFSAEKRPATAIVTARNKPYDGGTTATLDISWKAGDLINGDDITLNLAGAFDDANVGTDKIVRISRSGGLPDGGGKYAVTYNTTTTASITAQAATVSGVNAGPWTYSGSEQPLLSGGSATNGTIVYSLNGTDFMDNVPTETNAGKYQVWYKARGNTNYADSEVHMVYVAIQPKTVASPTIELSSDSLEYDGTAKEPDVLAVKDGSNVIPASEYTVGYSNNVNVGTTAKVIITDVAGGNYTVSGSRNFTITAAAASLINPPQPNDLTYTGKPQALVTAGTAANGRVMYSLDGGEYGTAIPRATDAGDYEVMYKVVDENGKDATTEEYVYVTIDPKEVTPIIRLENRSSYSVAYNGNPQEPDVTVYVESKLYTGLYDVSYANNTDVGTAEVTVQSIGGNYQFLAFKTFEITKGKAEFLSPPTAKTNLAYNGTAQQLVNRGFAKDNGIVLYSLDNSAYTTKIPTGINRDSYTVFAKVQGNNNYEESGVVVIPVEIGVNTVQNPTVSLPSSSFPYTGSEVKPTVTVADDDGNIISADEYNVAYGNNVNIGTATVSIKSKTAGNYSFTASTTFTITDASQTPLAITGKQDPVCYGDTLHLGTTGGSGDSAVTWTTTGPVTGSDGQYKVTSSGSVTITATKGSSTDTWTFFAKPKPVTAIVMAASKPYDGNNTAQLTVTLSGLVPGETISTNTPDGVSASGYFADPSVGDNKTVTIQLNVPEAVSEKYAITGPDTTTASITPAAAKVVKAPEPAQPLTYNGTPQTLLADGGTAEGGNIAYSVDGGTSYSFELPTGTDAKSYTVWYKVSASDKNHEDSVPVKMAPIAIGVNTDTPSVLCTPSTVQYDGREKTPTVVVRDSAQRVIPESEYTVAFDPKPMIAVGKYKVTVTDKPGGNYQFANPVEVEEAFEITASSQNPLSISTDKATDVYYGDSIRLTALGGSGSGAIQWSVDKPGVAEISSASGNNCVVTVKGTEGFTVSAYRVGADGYSDSNTDSVPFVAHPKPVAPVVTAADKPYDGGVTATLTASCKSGDLVAGDTITFNVAGEFATADAGSNKQVKVLTHTAAGTNADKYAFDWPETTTAAIQRVDAKVDPANKPAAVPNLTYTGSAQNLVTGGKTVGDIGALEYSLSQSGGYSENIPTAINVGKYNVWYRVQDSVNYMGFTAGPIEVEIKKANPTISTNPTASGTAGQSLNDIPLNGGAINGNVPGRFAWKDGAIKPEIGNSPQWVVFTPNDTANYNVVEFQIDVTITSSTPSGGGSGTSDAPSSGTDSTPSTGTNGQTTIQNGTASTVVNAADMRGQVKEAAANKSQSIVIKPEITGDVTKSQVSIPASTVSQIGKETSAALTVSTPIADVTVPNGALDTLGSAGGAVNVVAEQTERGVALTLTANGRKVEEVPGGVTLAVPAADAGPGTVAVLVHEDGTRETLRKSVVEDGKVNIPLNGSGTVEIVDNSKDFADVPPTNWAADAVAFASAHELFSGTSETTFSPDQAISRGMLATVLYSLEGSPDQDAACTFSDVSGETWYTDGVVWATENGIASGYGNGQFGPNDSITREQFVVMLWKYAGSPKAGNQALGFTDSDQASGYALEALSWAVEKGIMSGYANGQLAPGGTATRAQAAQMLKNFMEST
jgi:methionine-rich copper-binding protein CopC